MLKFMRSINVKATPEQTFLLVAVPEAMSLPGKSVAELEGKMILARTMTGTGGADDHEVKIIDAEALTVKWRSNDSRLIGELLVTPWKSGANILLGLHVKSESQAAQAKIEQELGQWQRRLEQKLGRVRSHKLAKGEMN